MATTDRRFGLSIGTAIKPACYVASTANLVLSSSQVIDGLAVGSSQRVLVKDQTEPTENGIYDAGPFAWARSLDLNGANDAIPGTIAYVDRGTANSASFWVLNSSSTAAAVTIEGFSTGDDLVWSNITGLISGDASNATVIATGSTAARALDDRFADFANVLDEGAEGDGIANDSAAFTATEAHGKLGVIPKTANGYELTTTVSTTDGAWFVDPTLTWSQFSDDGQLDILRGFDTNNGANVWRFADRVFVGEAAAEFAGDNLAADGGDSWFDNTNYPGYLGINAQLLTVNNVGKYGIVAATRASDGTGTQVIGFGAATINDKASGSAWGFIAELQHETGGNQSFGIEIAAKNSSATSNNPKTPYTATGGVFGVWCAGGGDNAFGPASTRASNAAFVVLKNSQSWQRGLVCTSDGIDGTDGSAGSVTNGIAISLARRHLIQWNEPDTDSLGAAIYSTVTDAAGACQIIFGDNTVSLEDKSGNAFAQFIDGGDANYPLLRSGAGGGPVRYEAAGSDTNIDIYFVPKGTGVVRFGTHAGIVAETVTGYITIRDAGNTVRKLAVVS